MLSILDEGDIKKKDNFDKSDMEHEQPSWDNCLNAYIKEEKMILKSLISNLNSTPERGAPILAFSVHILTHCHEKVNHLGRGWRSEKEVLMIEKSWYKQWVDLC